MNILCTICQDIVNLDDGNTFATPCGHIFHYSCLIDWLQRSRTCPQCCNRVLEHSLCRLYPSLSNEEQDQSLIKQLQSCLEEMESNMEKQKLLCKEKDAQLSLLNANLKTRQNSQFEIAAKHKQEVDALKEENESLKRNIQSANCLTELAATALKEHRKNMDMAQSKEMNALRIENDNLKHNVRMLQSDLTVAQSNILIAKNKLLLAGAPQNMELNKTRGELDALKEKLSTLNGELGQQEAIIRDLKAKLGDEDQDCKTTAYTSWLMDKYAALHKDMQTLKLSQIEKLRKCEINNEDITENRALKDENERLKKENETLTQKIWILEVESGALHIYKLLLNGNFENQPTTASVTQNSSNIADETSGDKHVQESPSGPPMETNSALHNTQSYGAETIATEFQNRPLFTQK